MTYTVPIILVSNKLDLRANSRLSVKQSPVKQEEGQAVATKIGAYAYVECSAITQEGVYEVFETAVRATLGFKKRNSRLQLLQNKFKSLKSSIKLPEIKNDQPWLSKLIPA